MASAPAEYPNDACRIVEKQERSQHGAFTHTLRSRKVHIPVYSDLGIGDIRAIYKNDFIQVLHLRLQFE